MLGGLCESDNSSAFRSWCRRLLGQQHCTGIVVKCGTRLVRTLIYASEQTSSNGISVDICSNKANTTVFPLFMTSLCFFCFVLRLVFVWVVTKIIDYRCCIGFVTALSSFITLQVLGYEFTTQSQGFFQTTFVKVQTYILNCLNSVKLITLRK